MESLHSEELCRHPHRLSHCGNIFVFNCKRASATNDSERRDLIFSSLSFEQQDNVFVKAADGTAVISGKTAAGVDIVKCERAKHVQKRLTTPCILVAKASKKGESFQYSLLTLSSSNRLEPCMKFKLAYQMRGNVSILQGGPTVSWSHAGHVYYTSPQAGEVRKIPIQFSHSVVGELPLHKEQVFVLGLQNFSEQQSKGQPETGRTLGYFVESGQVFDGTMMLPDPYIRITRCVLVLSAQQVDGVLKSVVVAGTSSQQLVLFEDGIVKDACQLPFEQPEHIQVVDTGRNGQLFVVSFHQGHVCAIRKETCQIASQWSGVSSVHVDDFVGCGTDQMLLVFEDQGVSGRLERFLLTDLCGISYARTQDNEAPTTSAPSPPENYLLTLQALGSRLQSGLTVLQELQREARVKERVVQQSVQALTDVVSGREHIVTPPEQEGLISLWDSDDDDDEDDDESKDQAMGEMMQDVPAVSSKPHVDKVWHRIYEDQMVVGVILTTDASVPPALLSLSVLTETGQNWTPTVIQTRSRVFRLPASHCSSSFSLSPSPSSSMLLEPAAKRSKRHNAGEASDLDTCRVAVTAVTDLTPLLNRGSVECRVALHYLRGPDASALHCGRVALDMGADFKRPLLKNPELKTEEVTEDLLSLMSVLEGRVFHIDSPNHSLGDIEGWIGKRVGCKRIEASPEHLLLDSSGPSSSSLMLLHWHQINPFQGELTVHSSQLQMLQFLDSFLAHLPAHCSIQPVRGTGGSGAFQTFALALEREVQSLREGASSLLCGEDEVERASLGLGPGERQMWQQDVDRSRTRLSPLVDVGRYRKLIEHMSKVQLEGDLAALLCPSITGAKPGLVRS